MSEYGSVAERRIFPRYSLHVGGEAEVLFRRTPVPVEGEDQPGSDGRYPIDIVNISQGGAQLTFGAPFDAHDVVRLFLTHPITGNIILLEGELVWVRKNASHLMGRYYAGLSFRDIHNEGLADMVAYAATLGPQLAS